MFCSPQHGDRHSRPAIRRRTRCVIDISPLICLQQHQHLRGLFVLTGYAEKYLALAKGGEAKATVSTYTGGEAKQKANLGGATYLAAAFPVPSGVQAKPYHVLQKLLSNNSANSCTFYAPYSSSGLWGFHVKGSSPTEANNELAAGVKALQSVVNGAGDIETIKQEVCIMHPSVFCLCSYQCVCCCRVVNCYSHCCP